MIGPVGLVLTFVVGVLVGLLLPVDAFEIARTGKGLLMPSTPNPTSSTRLRVIGIALVTAALIANGLVGFLLIATRAAQSEQQDQIAQQQRQLAGLVICLQSYTHRLGTVLDDREAASTGTTEAARTLWHDYREQVRALGDADPGNPADEERIAAAQKSFNGSVDRYLESVGRNLSVRERNALPDPDVCFGKEIAR